MIDYNQHLKDYRNDPELYATAILQLEAIMAHDIVNVRKLYDSSKLEIAVNSRWGSEQVHTILSKSEIDKLELKYLYIFKEVMELELSIILEYCDFIDKYSLSSSDGKICFFDKSVLTNLIYNTIYNDILVFIKNNLPALFR